MKRIGLLLLTVTLGSSSQLQAQRYVRQGETIDYELAIGEPDGAHFKDQKPEEVNRWWKPFLEKATIGGSYCYDVVHLPVFDRPELGDKAAILNVGGPAQLVQVIEIPPGGKTAWHGYGWDGEPLFFVIKGRGRTDYRWKVGGLAPSKYDWKKNSLFALPVEHRMQHVNTDPEEPARLLAVIGYGINLYPYVARELRSGRQSPTEGPEERAATTARATYPGNFVEDLREHPVTVREARGSRIAFFDVSVVGHRTHDDVKVRENIAPVNYAHKHGSEHNFMIISGEGYDLWSAAPDLKAFEAEVREGKAIKAAYKEGVMCCMPPGPYWHQHYRTSEEELRFLVIAGRGEYEPNPDEE